MKSAILIRARAFHFDVSIESLFSPSAHLGRNYVYKSWLRRRSAAQCLIAVYAALGMFFFASELLAEPDILLAKSPKRHHLHFEHIGIEQGLSQNSIYAMTASKRGFLWIGTEDGLNRYDGYNITVYRHDPFNETSLAGNLIHALLEDRKGRLWIGSEGGGLHRFNPNDNTFTRFRHEKQNPHSLSNNFIRAIAEAPDGILWIATANGLNAFNPETAQTMRYMGQGNEEQGIKNAALVYRSISPNNSTKNPPTTNSSNALSVAVVTAVAVDAQGIVWAGTWGGGINRLDPRTGSITHIRHQAGKRDGLLCDTIQSLHIDTQGVLWIGTISGVGSYHTTRGVFQRYSPTSKSQSSAIGRDIRSFWQQNDSTLWIATGDEGISILNTRTGEAEQHRSEQTDECSLNTNIITCIYGDRAGIVWVGTGGSGINKYDPRAWKFFSYHRERNNLLSLSHNLVRGFYEDNATTLWVATEDGLNLFNRCTGEFRSFRHDPNNRSSLRGDVVRVIYRDARKRLWIGTNKGLHRAHETPDKAALRYMQGESLPPKTVHFEAVPVILSMPSGIRREAARKPHQKPAQALYPSVRAILENDDGSLWIGTQGMGLLLFQPSTMQFRQYKHDASNERSLNNSTIISLYRDRKGTLWVGTLHGLHRFHPETQDFTRFLQDPENPHSLHSNNIHAMLEDAQGRFWIGTWGGGLHLFDRETGYCDVFRERDGLPNDVVYGILPDKHGYLWLTTNKGLARFHPLTRTFRIYDADDGLQSNEFNAGAYHVGTASGRLYVGGVNGFSEFFPDSIRDNDIVPPVLITGLKKYNTRVHTEQDLANNADITLQYKDKFFTIEFAALGFTHARKNRYQYKLEGFDKAWIDAGTSREASYTNLDPGSYTFYVKASNNDGVWNEEGAKLHITILPPWWMTLWFRLGMALCLVSSGSLWFWTHLRRMKFQKRELERLVQLRTAELEEMNTTLKDANHEIEQHIQTVSEQAWEIATINTQLQARNQELEMLNREKDEFLGIAAHDLKNPLTGIVLSTEMLQYNLNTLTNERILERLQSIEATAMRMRDIVTDLLDINALESGKLPLQMDAHDALLIVEEVVQDYQGRAEEKNIALELHADPDGNRPYIYADFAKTREVLDNLISNAIKYSPFDTTVAIRLKYTDPDPANGRVRIEVADNGPGLSENDKERLFQRFARLSAEPTGGEHSTGLGLSIAKKLMEAMNGTIWCESTLGKGATFIAEFSNAFAMTESAILLPDNDNTNEHAFLPNTFV